MAATDWQYKFAWLPVHIAHHRVWLRWYAVRTLDVKTAVHSHGGTPLRVISILKEYSHRERGEFKRWEEYIGTCPFRFKGPWVPSLYWIAGDRGRVS